MLKVSRALAKRDRGFRDATRKFLRVCSIQGHLKSKFIHSSFALFKIWFKFLVAFSRNKSLRSYIILFLLNVYLFCFLL